MHSYLRIGALAPVLFGLLSRRLDRRALWWSAGLCIPLGLALHLGFIPPRADGSGAGFLHRLAASGGFWEWLSHNSKTMVGVVLPLMIVLICQLRSRHHSPVDLFADGDPVDAAPLAGGSSDTLPQRIVGGSMVTLGLGMLALLPVNPGRQAGILVFATLLLITGLCILHLSRRRDLSSHD